MEGGTPHYPGATLRCRGCRRRCRAGEVEGGTGGASGVGAGGSAASPFLGCSAVVDSAGRPPPLRVHDQGDGGHLSDERERLWERRGGPQPYPLGGGPPLPPQLLSSMSQPSHPSQRDQREPRDLAYRRPAPYGRPPPPAPYSSVAPSSPYPLHGRGPYARSSHSPSRSRSRSPTHSRSRSASRSRSRSRSPRTPTQPMSPGRERMDPRRLDATGPTAGYAPLPPRPFRRSTSPGPAYLPPMSRSGSQSLTDGQRELGRATSTPSSYHSFNPYPAVPPPLLPLLSPRRPSQVSLVCHLLRLRLPQLCLAGPTGAQAERCRRRIQSTLLARFLNPCLPSLPPTGNCNPPPPPSCLPTCVAVDRAHPTPRRKRARRRGRSTRTTTLPSHQSPTLHCRSAFGATSSPSATVHLFLLFLSHLPWSQCQSEQYRQRGQWGG